MNSISSKEFMNFGLRKSASLTQVKQEDPLRSYSLVSAIVCSFVLIIVLKFVGNECHYFP